MNNETYYHVMPQIIEGLKVSVPALRKALKRKPGTRHVECVLRVGKFFDRLCWDNEEKRLTASILLVKGNLIKAESIDPDEFCSIDLDEFCEDDFNIIEIPLPTFLITSED